MQSFWTGSSGATHGRWARSTTRYRVPLFRFCLRMLKDTARAEDAVHDTFVKLARQHTASCTPAALQALAVPCGPQ